LHIIKNSTVLTYIRSNGRILLLSVKPIFDILYKLN